MEEYDFIQISAALDLLNYILNVCWRRVTLQLKERINGGVVGELTRYETWLNQHSAVCLDKKLRNILQIRRQLFPLCLRLHLMYFNLNVLIVLNDHLSLLVKYGQEPDVFSFEFYTFNTVLSYSFNASSQELSSFWLASCLRLNWCSPGFEPGRPGWSSSSYLWT